MRSRDSKRYARQPQGDLLLGLDELGQIPVINRLAAALTAGRKPGLFVVAAAQHVNQVAHKYGDQWKETFANFGTKLILGQGDAEAAEFWSREIGETEIREWHRSMSSSHGSVLDNPNHSRSRTEHIRMRRRVLAHEIRELPKLTGYLMLGHHPAVKIRLKRGNRPDLCNPGPHWNRTAAEGLTAGEALRKKLASEQSADGKSGTHGKAKAPAQTPPLAGHSAAEPASVAKRSARASGSEDTPVRSSSSPRLDLSDIDCSER